MTTVEQISALRTEAARNPVAKDVFVMFASRARTRQTVNLVALERRMEAEGFKHTRAEYQAVLKFLANLGFGKLDLGSRGRIKGLKEVKVTVQSIGAIACGQGIEIKHLSPRVRFGRLSDVEVIKAPPAKPWSKVKEARRLAAEAAATTTLPRPLDAVPAQVAYEQRTGLPDRRRQPRPYQVLNAQLILTYTLGSGKAISIPIPPDFSAADIAKLAEHFQVSTSPAAAASPSGGAIPPTRSPEGNA